jgi:hypothetical protein
MTSIEAKYLENFGVFALSGAWSSFKGLERPKNV